jgi:hypothetical protein
MQLLTHLIAPKMLWLMYKAVNNHLPKKGNQYFKVGSLTMLPDGEVELHYDDSEEVNQASNFGFDGLFDIAKYGLSLPLQAYHKEIRHFLEKRVVSESRPDFNDFLKVHGINPDRCSNPTLFQKLAYSGGQIAGDNFSFVPCLEGAIRPFELLVEVKGLSHHYPMLEETHLKSLLGKHVSLTHEPENKYDSKAIVIAYEQATLGYLPTGYARQLTPDTLANLTTPAVIIKLNGSKANPKLFLKLAIA